MQVDHKPRFAVQAVQAASAWLRLGLKTLNIQNRPAALPGTKFVA